MEDAELGLTIAFNGCIYNHHELRDELSGSGRRVRWRPRLPPPAPNVPTFWSKPTRQATICA
jgi:hypothetical protein